MSKIKITDFVTQLLAPIINAYSFELVDVEYVKEGANWYLRVYIDKPGGITIDDCEIVSKELSKKLDETDPIKQSYLLEVSSPGIDRPLKRDSDYEKYKGEDVEIRLFKPIEGKKSYEGELIGLIEDKIVIKTDNDNVIKFNKNEVAVTKRIVKFNNI